jgi:hypothetical protein
MKRKKIRLTDAAELYGKTKAAMYRQLKRRGIAADKDGLYDEKAVSAAVHAGALEDKNAVQKLIDEGAFESGSMMEKKLVEQVRKLTAEADTAEFKLAQMRGDHIPKPQHRERLLAIVNACKRTIDVWVKTTAAEVGKPAFKKKLEEAQRKAYAATEAEYEAATE